MYKIFKIHPMEREFEAWIVREIEDYYLAIGLKACVHAVSYEKTVPADEMVKAYDKIFGLQFKRSKYDKKNKSVYWELNTRSDQMSRVKACKYIYYALPCFFNRDFARVSLSHVLFWRPEFADGERLLFVDNPTPKQILIKPSLDVSDVKSYSMFQPISFARYEKFQLSEAALDRVIADSARSKKNRTVHDGEPNVESLTTYGIRWGRFSEEIFDCNIGIRTNAPNASEKVKEIISAFQSIERGDEVVSVLVGLDKKESNAFDNKKGALKPSTAGRKKRL